MTIHYIPNLGFEIDSKEIKWNETRATIRQNLLMEFQHHDGVLDNSKFFGGDMSYNIHYRYDLYKNFKAIYDQDDCLKEFEVHNEIDILILGKTLKFGEDISKFIYEFNQLGYTPKVAKEGEFFFDSLKMVIANSESMGGEGNGLDYFYAARDVNHVIEEYSELMK